MNKNKFKYLLNERKRHNMLIQNILCEDEAVIMDEINKVVDKVKDKNSIGLCLINCKEELSELIIEINKYLRLKDYDKYDMVEEIADVIISIKILSSVCGITTQDILSAIHIKSESINKKINSVDNSYTESLFKKDNEVQNQSI